MRRPRSVQRPRMTRPADQGGPQSIRQLSWWHRSNAAPRVDHALKDDPQPQVALAFGLLNTKPRPMISSLKSTSVPLR